MKKIFAFILLFAGCLLGTAQTRMIVMSDIGGSDPDDAESMIHLMVSLDQVNLEGIISQHAWVPYGVGAVNLLVIINKNQRIYLRNRHNEYKS